MNYRPSERDLAAFHEAGHCVAGHALGCSVGAVTIDAATEGAGCAWVSHPRLRLVGDIDRFFYKPVPLWPAPVLRPLQTDVMVSLAGWVGESFASGVLSARRATPSVLALDDADEHGRPWPHLSALTRTERAAVTAWQATPPEELVDDDTRAAETIRLLHGDDVATGTLHARWLNSEVRRLLEYHAAAVERLADALLTAGSLGARDIRRLVVGGHSRARSSSSAVNFSRSPS